MDDPSTSRFGDVKRDLVRVMQEDADGFAAVMPHPRTRTASPPLEGRDVLFFEDAV
jgi:hypothetical protein